MTYGHGDLYWLRIQAAEPAVVEPGVIWVDTSVNPAAIKRRLASSWEVVASGGGTAVTDHGALTGLTDDDHSQYQRESEKDQSNGYPGLDASGFILDSQIPSGIARDTEVTTAVLDHAALADPHTGYLLESLIDAAGDLIVGTADNTPGRLAKGANLTRLGVNGSGNLAYLSSVFPFCSIYSTTDQSIANNTWTSVEFQLTSSDSSNMHDPGVDTTLVTVPEGGLYLAIATLNFYANAAGARYISINSFGDARVSAPHASISEKLLHIGIVRLTASATTKVQVFQSSGAALSLNNAQAARFVVAKIGE